MNCPRCQAENREGLRFCAHCGARLALTCPSCGFSYEPGEKFCGGCAAPLASVARPPDPKFASPESYTPKHLAEKILTSKSALEGERKQVTVLFADLKGSMELLADRDPEEARSLLDPVLERMMEAVHRYEGTVNQVMGDGIMALFGAPLAHEDHAVRAGYAALRMQENVGRYAEELRRSQGLDVQIRVGLNSGEVVVRSIGSDLHMDYTAVGQPTHLAARMEQLAKPGSVFAAAHTLRLAEGRIQVKPLGPVHIKGLGTPIEVYEIIGAGPVRSRLQAGAIRGLTPFVGRDAELGQLRRALQEAAAGRGQIVAVVGEPGLGKSRLLWEFTRSRRTHDELALECGSVPYGKSAAYLPVIDLLKTYFQIDERDEERQIREKVVGKLRALDETLVGTLPAFLALLDLPTEEQWQALDPAQRRLRTLEAVRRLLLRESHVRPVLLVLEDLHWIDSETQALLDSLVESLPTAPIFLLATYRPEYQHSWGHKAYYTELRIDPFDAQSAEVFLEALLGNGAGLEPLKQFLIERTQGNPFFVEETVRTLVETDVLLGERDTYRLAKGLESIQVPATVQAVLAARIDRLPPEEKDLLQTAAVIGKDVALPLLRAISHLSEDELQQALAHLQAAAFLYERGLFPELEYTFKHALTQEVAYGSLLQQRRRTLHAGVVEAIERLHADRLTEQVERLAHHAVQGEIWDKALPYLRQAGTKAVERSAYREAVAYFEQALAALSHLPRGRETLEEAIDLRLDLRNSLFNFGEFGRILNYLREAETLAEGLGDRLRLGRLHCYIGNHFWMDGDYDRALGATHEARAIAEDLGDFALQVHSNFYLGLVYQSLGDYRQAADFLRRNVAALQGDLMRERFGMPILASVLSRTQLGRCLGERGEFAEGIATMEEVVRVAEEADQPNSVAYGLSGLGFLYLHRGHLHKAIAALERGLELCRTWDNRLLPAAILPLLGYAYAMSGRAAQGIALLQRVVEQTMATRRGGPAMARLGEAYLLVGRIDDAMTCAARSLQLSCDRKERGEEAHGLRFLGEIASHVDPPDTHAARSHYNRALALGAELSMRPLLARCHLGLGKLYRGTGDGPKAQEHLTTATTMLREMDMRFWLEQAEAELKDLS